MSRIRRYMPRPGLVVAIVALLAATAGTSYAIRGQFGVGKLKGGVETEGRRHREAGLHDDDDQRAGDNR
jgi:hypothetical protein